MPSKRKIKTRASSGLTKERAQENYDSLLNFTLGPDPATTGGSLTLPDNYAVIEVNLDAKEPYCVIEPTECDDNRSSRHLSTVHIPIPKSLAYYLRTHDNGSKKFRHTVEVNARNALRDKIRGLLEQESSSYPGPTQ
jgi:hypothetical protein